MFSFNEAMLAALAAEGAANGKKIANMALEDVSGLANTKDRSGKDRQTKCTLDELCELGLHGLDLGQTLDLVLGNDLQSLVIGLVDAQSRCLVGSFRVASNRLN